MSTSTAKTRASARSSGYVPRAAASTPIQEKVVLLILTLHAPGNRRVVKRKGILNTDASEARLNITKKLIDAEECQAITILDQQIRGWLAGLALPSPFKTGTHVIALGLLDMVDAKLNEYREKRAVLVDKFVAVYDAAQNEAALSLGALYNPGDYPSAALLREAYAITWQYVTLAPPESLQELNADIFERERYKMEQQWTDAIDTMRDALRVGLSELVDDMVARLDSPEETKFKPTRLLGRFTEFLSTFDARNVTNDDELAALAAQARSLLEGVDKDTLKTSADVRSRVRVGFKQAQTTLASLELTARKQRRISFDDE